VSKFNKPKPLTKPGSLNVTKNTPSTFTIANKNDKKVAGKPTPLSITKAPVINSNNVKKTEEKKEEKPSSPNAYLSSVAKQKSNVAALQQKFEGQAK
jgi:hypothetical protein